MLLNNLPFLLLLSKTLAASNIAISQDAAVCLQNQKDVVDVLCEIPLLRTIRSEFNDFGYLSPNPEELVSHFAFYVYSEDAIGKAREMKEMQKIRLPIELIDNCVDFKTCWQRFIQTYLSRICLHLQDSSPEKLEECRMLFSSEVKRVSYKPKYYFSSMEDMKRDLAAEAKRINPLTERMQTHVMLIRDSKETFWTCPIGFEVEGGNSQGVSFSYSLKKEVSGKACLYELLNQQPPVRLTPRPIMIVSAQPNQQTLPAINPNQPNHPTPSTLDRQRGVDSTPTTRSPTTLPTNHEDSVKQNYKERFFWPVVLGSLLLTVVLASALLFVSFGRRQTDTANGREDMEQN